MKEYKYSTSEGDLRSFKAARLDFMACNPFTQEKVPVYLVDGFLHFPNLSDTYMGVPSESEMDSQFVNLIGLPIKATQNISSKWKVRGRGLDVSALLFQINS